MEKIDLLIAARWVIPITPPHCVLENYAVLVHKSRILRVLPLAEAQQQYRPKQSIELKDHVLMPGLVNAHAHTPMNLFRGLADDLNLMDWLHHHIWPAEKALINAQSVTIGTRLAIAEMLRGGITCFNDNYFFHDTIAKVAAEEGIRACVGMVIMSVPTEWAKEEAGYFQKAIATLEHAQAHPLITWSLAPHAPYTVSNASLRKVKEWADQYQLPIHMHVHETPTEIEQSLKEHGVRPLERLHRLGLLSPRFIGVHMTQLVDDDIHLLQNTQAHVVHCPESNLKLASGIAPIAQLLKKGINVAIGTDGAASNNDLDLWGELRTAALLAKVHAHDPTCLPAHEALAMATLHGAQALGLEKEIGSIEVGKSADLIAIDLSSYLTQPVYHPISHLVYAVNRLQVSDVWIQGKQLLKKGVLTQLETHQLVEAARYWADKAAPFGMRSIYSSRETVS
ncbi:MAG: N-ethylammeline chlorohydrolase [Coxiella sp. RIFCSPHIGHO2_12_FULL_44_14]|nr:MAG: N-ethylammeline chlorohydrolase [Coxiella sp. RIFCSPHIGHO2_12_FULL_44_14]